MNIASIIAMTIPVIERLINYVTSMRTIARQTGELTQAEDDALDARIAALFTPAKPDHWKTDAELRQGPQ